MVWTIGRVVDELKKTETKLVWPKRFEDGLFDAAISGASWLNHYGIDGPWLVMATVTGIKDYHLIVSNDHWSDPAWRDQATLPPLIIGEAEVASAFEKLDRACGALEAKAQGEVAA